MPFYRIGKLDGLNARSVCSFCSLISHGLWAQVCTMPSYYAHVLCQAYSQITTPQYLAIAQQSRTHVTSDHHDSHLMVISKQLFQDRFLKTFYCMWCIHGSYEAHSNPECQGWCARHKQTWASKCTWKNVCDGCSDCEGSCLWASKLSIGIGRLSSCLRV